MQLLQDVKKGSFETGVSDTRVGISGQGLGEGGGWSDTTGFRCQLFGGSGGCKVGYGSPKGGLVAHELGLVDKGWGVGEEEGGSDASGFRCHLFWESQAVVRLGMIVRKKNTRTDVEGDGS